MHMSAYLLFLAIGIGIIWVSLRFADDVFRLAGALSGAIFVVWGFAQTPLQLQLPLEVLVLVIVFPLCMRCVKS